MLNTLETIKEDIKLSDEKPSETNFAMAKTTPANIDVQGDDVPELNLGTFELDMPEQIQNSLDQLIDFYKENAMKPVVKATGSPLDICAELSRQLKQSVPQEMIKDVKHVIDYLIDQIVDFARARRSKSLSIHFMFEREHAGRNPHEAEIV